ncbi:MAG: hypothetical protein A3B79_04425 [Deltaproteobacteria bacterium RIFCSPHIGHO2_02_FULL_50_15]|nr:MAG: hypothetical protein A3B79_04425 [Deltaproteobacteria bacterium RIFCSPHIGHO2_02_FULL_50_15]
MRGMTTHLNFRLGAGILFLILLTALVSFFWSPTFLSEHHLIDRFLKPSLAHPFGCDEDGYDLLVLVFYGARVSLFVSLSTVFFSAVFGIMIGGVAGYFGGRLDELFIFISDVFLSFPSILLVIALAAFRHEPTVWGVIFILSVVGWVGYARVVRGQVLSMKKKEFIQSAEISGIRFGRLLWHHLLPNMAGPLLVQATFGMAGVILVESTLSFLGLGVPVDVPSWGRLLDQGVQYLLIAPHISVFSGLAIMLAILGFNLLGDGLRDMLDIRSGGKY